MFDVLILQSPPSALKGHIYPRESWKRSIQSRREQLKSMAVFPAGSAATYLPCVSTLHTVKSFRLMHGIKYVVYIFIFIFFSAWFPQLWKTVTVQEGVCKKYWQCWSICIVIEECGHPSINSRRNTNFQCLVSLVFLTLSCIPDLQLYIELLSLNGC